MNGKEAAKQLQGAIGVKNESERCYEMPYTLYVLYVVVKQFIQCKLCPCTYVRTYTCTYAYVTKKCISVTYTHH